MDMIVTDRAGIEKGTLIRTTYIVVSIRDPEKPKARVKKQSGLRDTLYLAFYDAEIIEGQPVHSCITYRTEIQASEIVAFANKWRGDVGALVVHCEQGMSRSPAVAAGLSKRYALDDTRFFQEYQPNQYIYELILDCDES